MNISKRLIFAIITVSVIGACAGSAQAAQMKADKILIEKSKRELILLKSGKVIKTYHISLGRNPNGAKVRQGDGKTPEGTYTIDKRNPRSAYHLALHVSYPSSSDVTRARKLGVSPGGNIMVHGLPNGSKGWIWRRWPDWTAGCIAVSDKEIEEIWRAVPDGTPIEIRA